MLYNYPQTVNIQKRMFNNLKQNQTQWRTSQQLTHAEVYMSPCNPQGNPPATRNVEKQNQQFPKNTIPNSIKSKPLISPKTNQAVGRTSQNTMHRKSVQLENKSRYNTKCSDSNQNKLVCLNHQTKKAEFLVRVDSMEEHYCARCAAQLATQGCEVVKIEAVEGGMKVSGKSALPDLPEYQGEPIYEQIRKILRLCNCVVEEHNVNIQQFSSLEKTYQQQIDLTTSFYDRLVQIIEEMKGDHLTDLMAERDKYTQIADISNDYLRENIIEINVIKNDIENHLEEVLEGIRDTGDSHQCKESLEHYRQKMNVFRHQAEEQIDSIHAVTRYSQTQINTMVHSFEQFLETMWDSTHPNPLQPPHLPQKNTNKSGNSAMTVKNIHQILPKGVSYQNCEGKKAFRNLQDDEDGDLQERKSPNFKRI